MTEIFGALLSNPHNQRRVKFELSAGRERAGSGGGERDRANSKNNNHNTNNDNERAGQSMKQRETQQGNVFVLPNLFQQDFFTAAFDEAFRAENRGKSASHRRPTSASSSRQVTSSCCSVGGKKVVTKKIVDGNGERIIVEIDGVVTSDTLNGKSVRG